MTWDDFDKMTSEYCKTLIQRLLRYFMAEPQTRTTIGRIENLRHYQAMLAKEGELSAGPQWVLLSYEQYMERHLKPRKRNKPSIPQVTNDIPPGKRFKILTRDNFRCQLCGTAASDGPHVRLEVDHKISRHDGGSNKDNNLWTLCFTCNRGKGKHSLVLKIMS